MKSIYATLLLKISKVGVLIAAVHAGMRRRLKKKQAIAPVPLDRQDPK